MKEGGEEGGREEKKGYRAWTYARTDRGENRREGGREEVREGGRG